MAIKKLDRSFAPPTKEIRYLNKTFSQWRQSLIDFAKVYYPDSYSDFNETSPGMMFIEMASYVGDVLSYYIDSQFRENLMQYAAQSENIIAIAQSMGYKPKPATASSTVADFYQLCPAADVTQNYIPDTRFMMILDANTVVSSTQYSTSFRTTTVTDFSDPADREITVYAVSQTGQPITYLVKKSVNITSGTINTYQATFGAPQKFSQVLIPDTSVLEVISLVDSNGFVWNEVDYLAQDLVLDTTQNVSPVTASNQSVPPINVLKITRTPRRFVTRYDNQYNLELHFGSGVLSDTDATINLEPSKIASDEYQTNLASTSLDPSDFLSSNSYGLAPGNLTFTITYATGGGLQSNVPSNSINKIATVTVLNDTSVFTPTEATLFEDITKTLAISNSDPATGGKDADSVEEIRQSALAFFNSQNRLVNVQDYTVRVYAMPSKFGGIAKAYVAPDTQINGILSATSTERQYVQDGAGQNVINMYVLGYDNNKKLTNLNDTVKQNLATYLDQYRMLTDEIRIVDAFVVNIGVDFSIVVFKNYNMNEVIVRCLNAIQNFFDIDRWSINQPIILSDLFSELAAVDGVQSVTTVNITNKYADQDGSSYNDFYYPISEALQDGVIYPSLDPCIFELRFPQNDITASATQ